VKPLTDKEILPELKRRIKGALVDIQDSKLTSHNMIINNTHTIRFMVRNKDYLIEGTAVKRITDKEIQL